MTFIIAEAGINHNGKLELVKQLIELAKDAGADAIKFQTFWNIGRLKEYELSYMDWSRIVFSCDVEKILCLSTPHCYTAIDFVDEFVPIHKIASPYILDPVFVKMIASKNKPTLFSTGSLIHEDGMATVKEIEKFILWFGNKYVENLIMMHCVSKYPCDDGHYERLSVLEKIANKYDIPVGLSDHTTNVELPRGLPVYEKHIMLESQDCIDKQVSLTPHKFKEMVDWLR